ncbi:hypothetical protein FHP25_21815 [Vineibacter terrae]|uniref:Uncharacterized protein n=1 Tax=Vineibacter terrae TaxID=2586908 RepID=A0A5C8PJ97_9HYPH|nr:hypothetical protein [Vineibacter terrae]TXL73324.1 hypothetical protein FHP25_21815 [Vineibacter terrae]
MGKGARIWAGLVLACLTLAACYETAPGVLGRGADVALSSGIYRCENDKDSQVSIASISAAAQLAPDDVVYVATMEKSRYLVRIAAMADGLFLLEGRDDYRRAYHLFARRQGNDGYELLVADSAGARARLTALAGAHGVAIEFPNMGPPRIAGTPQSERAFLMAHTPTELQRVSTCRLVP